MIWEDKFYGKSKHNYQKRKILRKGCRSSVKLEQILKEVSLERAEPNSKLKGRMLIKYSEKQVQEN